MTTFMLTYPSDNGNQVLFETAFNEESALKKFRETLGRKKLPHNSEVIALKVDGHKIQRVEKKDSRAYFRWSQQQIVDMIEHYSLLTSGESDYNFISEFVERYKNELKGK